MKSTLIYFLLFIFKKILDIQYCAIRITSISQIRQKSFICQSLLTTPIRSYVLSTIWIDTSNFSTQSFSSLNPGKVLY